MRAVPRLVELAKSRGVKIKFSYCRPAGRAVHNQTILSLQDSPNYLKVLEYLNSPEVLSHVLMDEGMMFCQPVEVTQKLLRVGSSAAVTIPKKSLKELGLKIGDEVQVSVHPKERKVTILPARRIDIDKEILEWTRRFIKRYRPALKALANK